MPSIRCLSVALSLLASCGGTHDHTAEGGVVLAEEPRHAQEARNDPTQAATTEVGIESCPTEDLLEYLSGREAYTQLVDNEAPFKSGKWGLIEELSQREADLDAMVSFFQNCEYSAGKDTLLMVFMGMGEIAMQHPVLEGHVPDGLYQGSFSWVVKQARAGNSEALDRLSENFWDYAVPSRDLAGLPVFMAEQGRRELIPDFVHWIDAADMSLGGACFSAMQIFYPESKPPTEGPGPASRYYVEYASKEFPELAGE